MSNKTMRVLFVPREQYPTDRVRINVLFGRELLSRGHQIDVVMQAASESVAAGRHDWYGRTLFVGPTDSGDGVFHRARKYWLSIRHDLQRLLAARRDRYDAILVSDKFIIGFLAAFIARFRGLKYIFWLTFPYPEIDLLGARERTARYPAIARIRGMLSGWALYKWILRRADYVFVQTERMKETVCAHGVPPHKVSPIVSGFDLSAIALASPGEAATQARPAVQLAYLGTLSSDRHLEVLIDMLAQLKASGVAAKLTFVGHADRSRDRQFLEQRAAELGVADAIEITGFLPQREAWRRVAEADICLSPIWRSPIYDVGSPTKLVEYMAMGMPVVANDHPEQRLVLRESRAGVCVPWSGRHFARAVRWLMRLSPAERAAMGAKGRVWVEANRTYARIADDVERRCLATIGQSASTA
jgi:glycosyltransferase involved in cell wall biosynthesis